MAETQVTEVPENAVEAITERIEQSADVVGNSTQWIVDNQALIIDYGLNIIAAVLTLMLGMWVASIIEKAFQKTMTKRNVDSTIIDFVSHMVKYVVIAFVVIAALSKIGVQTTSFIAIIGAAGLAVGLALQGSLSNFASGVLIIVLRPFKSGEYIEAAGTAGVVESVQIFATTLTTPDNKFVVVPNSAILGGNIVNYSRKPMRRIDLVIGVSYNADLAQTKAVLEKTLLAHELVLKEPGIQVAVAELADSSVNFVVRPWVKSEDYWGVRFALTEQIKNALDDADISIPFPQMDVHMNKLD